MAWHMVCEQARPFVATQLEVTVGIQCLSMQCLLSLIGQCCYVVHERRVAVFWAG